MTAVHVSARRTDLPDHWFQLTLASRDRGSGHFLTHADSFEEHIRAMDDLARTYTIDNWTSGILSGLFFVLRRTTSRDWGATLSLLEGNLGSNDMDALATGAMLAAGTIHGLENLPTTLAGWEFKVSTVALNGPPSPHPSSQPV